MNYNGNNQEQTPEPILTDGQTEQLAEFEQTIQPTPADFCADSSLMMTNNQFYTQEEFNKCFNDFLTFLKSPEVAGDTFSSIKNRGQDLASKKVYELAQNYKFLRFLIDKNTHLIGDIVTIGLWASIEFNAIAENWTGINYLTKAKIWLNDKIKQRAQASAKRKGWAFLGRPVAEKQPKQDN